MVDASVETRRARRFNGTFATRVTFFGKNRPGKPHDTVPLVAAARTRCYSNPVATTACPHCGELIETFPDLGGGEQQEYIEDCSVCCRPISFSATFDPDSEDFVVVASPEV